MIRITISADEIEVERAVDPFADEVLEVIALNIHLRGQRDAVSSVFIPKETARDLAAMLQGVLDQDD